MTRLAYEGAADLYDHALHALEEIDDELPDRDDQVATLLVARCEALLAAGDVTSAAGAVSQLQSATTDSARLAAWATCFDGQLSMLIHPERLDEVEAALGAAAERLAGLDDAAGEANAHTVRAGCLARLGRIADCEVALDNALNAARRAREHRRVNAVLAGAPLAALWGPNPVPRAGGRCLDVVRLLRITTDSPAVEATSTQCQAVLEAFRGRAAAARRMIDSARRTVTELGLRHALCEVEQFAGIIELVADEPGAAEPLFRKAYNGFRRMRLEADTAETAALLGRTCLALGRDAEADELCRESERLAGHALKASIAWRTLRAQLLSSVSEHNAARRMAESAVTLAERTDALVDHGDACLTLARVLSVAGDVAGARSAAERAVGLYERKGAVALVETARQPLGIRDPSSALRAPEASGSEPDNECVRVARRVADAVDREAWDDADQLFAPQVVVESRPAHIELVEPQPGPETAAARVCRCINSYLLAGDLPSVADSLADDITQDDRRKVIGSGLRQGRNAVMAEIVITAPAVKRMTTDTIATRGERLVLNRVRSAFRDDEPDAFGIDVLAVVEIDADERVSARTVFDLDDFRSAIAELDARYLVGAAAPYAHTWSVIAAACNALNCHQAPPTTADWINVDHRVEAAFGPGDLIDYFGAGKDFEQDINTYVQEVHSLSNDGAVITYAAQETSREGLDAEWRGIALLLVDGEMIRRCEVFDEIDLVAADERFKQLDRPVRLSENAASAMHERIEVLFAARDWDALSDLMADDCSSDDRRRALNSGTRSGRDALVTEIVSLTEIGVRAMTSDVIATRGNRLALSRAQTWGRVRSPAAFHTDVLDVLEVNAEGKFSARVVFDLDHFDSALAELDKRYLAGEAARHSQVWSAVRRGFAALNRRELFATTEDWVNIDHRSGTSIAPGDMTALLEVTRNLASDISYFVATVDRLTDAGAVVTHISRETTPGGFQAEWRVVSVITFDGDLVNRCEVFDADDMDAALARFDQLVHRPLRRLENAASRMGERFLTLFAAGDWDAIERMLAGDFANDDRRRVVGNAVQVGREAQLASMRVVAELWSSNVTPTVIATRGEHLVLDRLCFSRRDDEAPGFLTEVLGILEIDGDDRIIAAVFFDLDDIDAAVAELDARYLAGEAATHANTWSVIARNFAAFNRHELPSVTPNWVNIDHRRARAFSPGELFPYVRATWELTPQAKIYAHAVHRLGDFGAVITQATYGTSQAGFDVEWREVTLFTVDGDLISRCEIFDEVDLDAALAELDELCRPAPQLENAASRALRRYLAAFAARAWQVLPQSLTEDFYIDDRRRVVNAGIRHGQEAEIQDMRAAADVGMAFTIRGVVATRGNDLALLRVEITGRDAETVKYDVLQLIQMHKGRAKAAVVFDANDFDAAVAELDSRYLAGDAASYALVWQTISGTYASVRRGELPTLTADCASVDHRRGAAFAAGELSEYTSKGWDLDRPIRPHIVAVHQLNELGAVVTYVAHGNSPAGFEAEWREVALSTVEGDKVNRCELFDETDLKAALARFAELHRPARRLENSASRVNGRLWAYCAARNWDAMAATLSVDYAHDDRRRMVGAGTMRGRDAGMRDMKTIAEIAVHWDATANMFADDDCNEDRRTVVNAGVRHGQDAAIEDLRVGVEVGLLTDIAAPIIATRGDRLVLTRIRASGTERAEIQLDALQVVELNADDQVAAVVIIDGDDMAAATAELEARFIAGEAAAHAHTWSVIATGYAALNKHKISPGLSRCVTIDHRVHSTFEGDDLNAYIRSGWDLTPNMEIYVESVHRLGSLGAVVTHTACGTSPDGFSAEWRMIQLLQVSGDRVHRCELFDEADLDVALAKFDELHARAQEPHNAAHRVAERFVASHAAGDRNAMADMLADNFVSDDRRRLVGSGIRQGRDAQRADVQAVADLSLTNVTSTAIATRGERLLLVRNRFTDREPGPEADLTEALSVIEITIDERVSALITFDVDDLEAAVAELDARYLAGEAAAHAHAWSVLTRAYESLNRREIPATADDFVDIDHRNLAPVGPGDLKAYLRAALNETAHNRIYVETVHRLTENGAVVTHVASGTSAAGFEAEWRISDIFMVEGDLLCRCEMFDEADLDRALAKFDELSRGTPLGENPPRE